MSERARNLSAVAVIGAALALVVVTLSSAEPGPEDRVARLAATLKCPVCASESIADSPADLARDLKDLIAEQVASGMSDDEIYAYFEATYGEQVRLDPPPGGRSALLWIAPLVAAAVGVLVILGRVRRQRPRRISDAERARVEAALRDHPPTDT